VLDDAGRLISRQHAEAIRTKIAGRGGQVARCSRERKSEPPPLPYSLPDLQVDAGEHLSLGPKQTLDSCQSLYETHRLLTYPRSDCRYLPEGQHEQGVAVLAAITPTEGAVYELVARRYFAQFHPPFDFDETKIEFAIGGERFRAVGRQTVAAGWRGLIPTAELAQQRDEPEDDGTGATLALVREGERIACTEVTIAERLTAARKRFTEASLIQAMTGIARYVQDPKIKQVLRETDGIGTPATQSAIIQPCSIAVSRRT
jgi:DNA topoisomerase-3